MSTTEHRGSDASDVTELRPLHSSGGGDGMTLRLLWPQWQGAGTSSVRELAPEFPFDVARRGYAVGSAVLAAVLPTTEGPTAAAPVAMDDAGLELCDGIEAKEVILTQLARGSGGHSRARSGEDRHPGRRVRGERRAVFGARAPLW